MGDVIPIVRHGNFMQHRNVYGELLSVKSGVGRYASSLSRVGIKSSQSFKISGTGLEGSLTANL